MSGKPKTSTHDSITAKESQIKEILKESKTVNLTNQEQSNSIQDEGQSHNNNTLESNKNGEESLRWCNPTDFYIRKSKISGYFYELLPNILLFAPFVHEFFDGDRKSTRLNSSHP